MEGRSRPQRAGLLDVLREWWRFILAGALAAALVAAVAASFAQRQYESTAELLVGPVSAEYGTLQASGQLGRTYAELAQSRRMVSAAARAARVKLPSDKLDETVRATSNEVTRLVELRVTYTDPDGAARIASALADQLIALRQRDPVRDSEQIEELMREDEIAGLGEREQQGVRTAVQRVLGPSNAGMLQVVDAAEPADGPSSPRVGLLMLLAALAGAVVAGVVAIVREGAFEGPDETEPVPGFEVDSYADVFSEGADGVRAARSAR